MHIRVAGRVTQAVPKALRAAGHTIEPGGPEPASLAGVDAVVYGAIGDGHRLPAGSTEAQDGGAVPRWLAAMAGAGVGRLVYLADLADGLDETAGGLSAAGLAQAEVLVADVDWTVLRVAPVFGADDRLTTSLVALARRMPLLPVPSSGGRQLQPVAALDLAEAVATVLADPLTVGGVYELAGADVLDVTTLLDRCLAAVCLSRAIVALPDELLRRAARALGRAGDTLAWLTEPGPIVAHSNRAMDVLGRAPRPCAGAALAYLRAGSTQEEPWPAD